MGMFKKKVRHLNDPTTVDYVLAAIAIFIGIICLYPMWYVLCMSISTPEAVAGLKVTFWPIGFDLAAYKKVLENTDMWRALAMSISYCAAALVLQLVSCMMIAFPLTRPNMKFRRFAVTFILIPMYFGGGMIASYIWTCKFLHLYDTWWVVVLPGINLYNCILCRTFLASIPKDLSESAYIDGASNTQVMLKIVLPLSVPVLAVISIYCIVGMWNSWFGSMLYQQNQDLHPIQMYLQRLLISQKVDLTKLMEQGASAEEIANAARQAMVAMQMKYSTIVFCTAPILMIYPMFQKHFVKGVMLGSLKG